MKQFLSSWGMEITAIILTFVAPVQSYIGYCTVLVLVDLLTGLMKAKKLQPEKGLFPKYKPYRPSYVKSRKAGKTISKWIIYTAGILVAHGATINFYPDYELAKAVAMAITFVEVKSIDENMEIVLGYSIFGKVISIFTRTEDEDNKEDKKESGQD